MAMGLKALHPDERVTNNFWLCTCMAMGLKHRRFALRLVN